MPQSGNQRKWNDLYIISCRKYGFKPKQNDMSGFASIQTIRSVRHCNYNDNLLIGTMGLDVSRSGFVVYTSQKGQRTSLISEPIASVRMESSLIGEVPLTRRLTGGSNRGSRIPVWFIF